MELSNITVLCKVLDNYGDIGVASRLCTEISAILSSERETGAFICKGQEENKPCIRLIVDSLSAYKAICPEVENKSVQKIGDVTVLDWNSEEVCKKEYTAYPPKIILQCFQCGYPAWLEKMLFEEDVKDDVYVIDIDYLTAEDWAEDFHKMASLTRRKKVHKRLFMPGFTKKTGGLLMKGRVKEAEDGGGGGREEQAFSGKVIERGKIYAREKEALPHTALVFGYERDYTPLADAILQSRCFTKVYAANGAGQRSFIEAWERANKPFNLIALPFIAQKEWDMLIMSVDIAFVRGEDSLAGAVLSAAPYVWQAYPQEGEAHLIKVDALLSRMETYFDKAHFNLLCEVWRLWNGGAIERRDVKDKCYKKEGGEGECLRKFILEYKAFREGFTRYAASLIDNGDMADNLIEYIKTL